MRQTPAHNAYPRGKTAPPVACDNVIERGQLASALRESVAEKALTLIVAPAGYGKTVLLSGLYAQLAADGQLVHWYNCASADAVPNAMSAFFRHIAQAGDSLADDDSLGLEASIGNCAMHLVSSLDKARRLTTVILENYHLAQSAETDALIEAILGLESPFLRLAISSRAKPTFASRKLMLAGRVAEYRARDLTFTGDDLARLASAILPNMASPNLRGVLERTEGWPVAIRLFLLAIKDGADKNRLLDEISASDTDIAEYLTEEVLRGQPGELQHFLTHTCFLEQFNEGVCAALLPDLDVRALLDQAQRNNLFIIKLESGSGWFRYHPIFRQYLLGHFDRIPRQTRAEMRMIAGCWFEEHGYSVEAVDMALAAGDACRARNLLAELAPGLVSVRGDLATFLQLIARFPRGMLDDDPTLLFWQAWAMFFAHRYREAAAMVANLHRNAQGHGVLAIDDGLRDRLGVLDAMSATFTDDMATTRRTASDWLGGSAGADPFDRATVACSLVLACLAFLDLAAARKAFDLAQRFIAQSDSAYGAAWVCAIGMTMDLVAGQPTQALARLDALGSAWAGTTATPSNISSTLSLLAAAAHYHLGAIEQAEMLVTENLHMLPAHGVSETAALGIAACLRITALKGGTSRALTLARQLEGGLAKAYAPRIAFTLRYERALLLFRNGRIEDAIEEASGIVDIQPIGERRQNEGEPEMPCIREIRQIIAVRIALVDQAWNEALRVLSGLIGAARHSGRSLRLVQALILKAAVHYGQGDQVKAVRAFLDAVAMASDRQLLQIFIDEARLCRPLVAAAMASFDQGAHILPDEARFVGLIQVRLGVEGAGVRDEDDIHAPLEPLTAREQLILELLHAGLRNREIAGRLSMSEATVKWHLYNLYSKLGVNNRTAAIHRARGMGLVTK